MPHYTQRPLDDSSDEAIALLAFLRRQPLQWFVRGSASARYAMELADAGYLNLRHEQDGHIELLRVVGGLGARR